MLHLQGSQLRTSQDSIRPPPMMFLQLPCGPVPYFVPGYPGKRSTQRLKSDLGFGMAEFQGSRAEGRGRSCFAEGGGAGWNPGTDPDTLRFKGAKQEESLF